MAKAKLVRDSIPEIIAAEGKKPITRTAGDKEYLELLKEKLMEEASEFVESGDIEELADILEVLRALWVAKGSSANEIEEIRERKKIARGGFEKRIVLEGTQE